MVEHEDKRTTESYKEDGRPAQQWYWDDWFSAFDVRLCSLAARGLWIDMLGIMWKAEIRGTLTINGVQVNSKSLAKTTNTTISEVNKLLKELEDNNVFSRLEDGTILCRRVFRESGKKDKVSQIRSEAGKKGAEKRWQKRWQNGESEDGKNMAKMATSSSSPTSSPTSTSINTYVAKNENDIEKEFKEFWKFYRSIGNPEDDIGDKREAFKAYKALRKIISKEEIAKAAHGEADYLKYKRLEENFEQRKKFTSTWLRSERWKIHADFKYKPRL